MGFPAQTQKCVVAWITEEMKKFTGLLKKTKMCCIWCRHDCHGTDWTPANRCLPLLPGDMSAISGIWIFKLRRKIKHTDRSGLPTLFGKRKENAACASETTSRPELPGVLFFSAHFCSLKQGIRKGLWRSVNNWWRCRNSEWGGREGACEGASTESFSK